MLMLALAGCSNGLTGDLEPASPDGRGSGSNEAPSLGPDAAVPDDAGPLGDPEAGYRFLVNGNYIGCGIPIEVMKRALAVTDLAPDAVLGSLFPLASAAVFAEPGIEGREGTNAELAHSFNAFETKRGVEAMNFNCLSCHAERLNGEVVVGLGNTTRDFSQDLRRTTGLLGPFARTDAEKAEVARFQEAIDAIAPYVITPTVGGNPAVNLTYALFARRDADFSWQSEPVIEPPSTEFPPVDVPPWWRMGKRDTMFASAEFKKKHHRIMSLAATLCLDTADEMRALEADFLNVEAFVKSVQPPPFPNAIDGALASEGKEIFEATCSECHGTYGPGGEYRERLVKIEEIGTDPGLMEQQNGEPSARFREWGEKFWATLYNDTADVAPEPGYIAPPLDGIWATAPFLHNGSVPSIEALLDSSKRPQYWVRKVEEEAYDIDNMAVGFTASNTSRAWTLPGLKRYVYDTTLKHHGNQGHTYGDKLSDAERRAVIEYLKTL